MVAWVPASERFQKPLLQIPGAFITPKATPMWPQWANSHDIAHLEAETVPMNLIWSELAEWLLSCGLDKCTDGQRPFHSPPFNLCKGQGTKITTGLLSHAMSMGLSCFHVSHAVTFICQSVVKIYEDVLAFLYIQERQEQSKVVDLTIKTKWWLLVEFASNYYLNHCSFIWINSNEIRIIIIPLFSFENRCLNL